MRGMAVTLLLLLALFLLVTPAGALGAEKPWFGGLYTGFCGFSEQTRLPAAEYLAIGLFAEPLAIHVLNPALSCGFLLPLAPANSEGLRMQVALELTLVDLPASFLKNRFYISSCWSPGLGVECLITSDFHAARFAILAAPLRCRVGDGVFTIGSIQLFLDKGARLPGWGIMVFKASLFLF